MQVCLSVCLSFCLSVCLSVCLSACLFLSAYLIFCVSVCCRTYEADREAFVSLCAQCPLNAAPCEVGVVCGIDQLVSSGCDCHTFTRYLDHVMVGGARPHPLHRERLLHQPKVLLGALEAVLIEGAGLDMSHDK